MPYNPLNTFKLKNSKYKPIETIKADPNLINKVPKEQMFGLYSFVKHTGFKIDDAIKYAMTENYLFDPLAENKHKGGVDIGIFQLSSSAIDSITIPKGSANKSYWEQNASKYLKDVKKFNPKIAVHNYIGSAIYFNYLKNNALPEQGINNPTTEDLILAFNTGANKYAKIKRGEIKPTQKFKNHFRNLKKSGFFQGMDINEFLNKQDAKIVLNTEKIKYIDSKPFNSTSIGIAVNTVLGLPKAFKELFFPARGFTEEEIKEAKPSFKEKLSAVPKFAAEFSSIIGELLASSDKSLAVKISKTKLGGELADIGKKIQEFGIPKTAEEAAVMRFADVVFFAPVGSLKVSATSAIVIAKTKNLKTIIKMLKTDIPKITEQQADTIGRLLINVNDTNAVQRVINKINFAKQEFIKANRNKKTLVDIFKKYKETDKLSTKLLKDLQGKSVVNKSYIEQRLVSKDLNLKQVEKNTVRQVLDGIKGDEINVQKFADSVKEKLLPLKIKSSAVYNVKTGKGQAGGMAPQHENVVLSKETRGNVENYTEHIYESPIKTSAGSIHFENKSKNYFGHVRIEDMADVRVKKIGDEFFGKKDFDTRRVLEIQTDLYQKGGLERHISSHGTVEDIKKIAKKEKISFKEASDKMSKDYLKSVEKLQQYNNPTAHFRMAREEIALAAKDGKTKLQFPTGETAMEIEGIGESAFSAQNTWFDESIEAIEEKMEMELGYEDEFDEAYNDASNLFDFGTKLEIDGIKVGKIISKNGNNWIITDVLGEGKFKAIPKQRIEQIKKTNLISKKITDPIEIIKEAEKVNEGLGLPRRQQIDSAIEQFDISGKIDTSDPIYKFYEKSLGKYLNSNYNAKRVVDEQGIEWFEIDITKQMKDVPVEAYGAIAGFEIDDEGNVSFDPAKAALGFAAIGTIKSIKPVVIRGKNFSLGTSKLTQPTNKMLRSELKATQKEIKLAHKAEAKAAKLEMKQQKIRQKTLDNLQKYRGNIEKIKKQMKKKYLSDEDIKNIIIEDGSKLDELVRIKRNPDKSLSTVITKREINEIKNSYTDELPKHKWERKNILVGGKEVASKTVRSFELPYSYFERKGLSSVYDPIIQSGRDAEQMRIGFIDKFKDAGLYKEGSWFTANRFDISKIESKGISKYYLGRQGYGKKIDVKNLSEKSQKFIKVFDGILEETTKPFYEVAQKMGKNPGKVKNYAPIMTKDDIKLVDEGGSKEWLFRKHPAFFSLKSRTKNKNPNIYEKDYRVVVNRWLNSVTDFIQTSEATNHSKYLIGSDDFRSLIKEEDLQIIDNWLKDVTTPKTPKTLSGQSVGKIAKFLRMTGALGALGLNYATILKQALTQIPIAIIEKSLPKQKSVFAKAFGIDVSKLPSITKRAGDIAIQDMQGKLGRIFTGGITKFDRKNAQIAINGLLDKEYKKFLKDGVEINKDAQKLILDNVQNKIDMWFGGFFKGQRPEVFREEIGNFILMFMYPLTSQTNGMFRHMLKSKGFKGNIKSVAEVLASVTAIAYTEQVIENLSLKWSDKKEMTKNVLTSLIGNIPVAGSIAYSLATGMNFSVSPIVGNINRITQSINKKDGEKISWSIAETLGLPRQIRKIREGIQILEKGGITDDSGKMLAPVSTTMDYVRAFLRGKYGPIASQDWIRNIGVSKNERRWFVPEVEFLQNGDYERKAELYNSFDNATKVELKGFLSESQQKKLEKAIKGESSSSKKSLSDIFK